MAKLEAVTMLLAYIAMPFSVLHSAEAIDFLFWDGPDCTGIVQTLCTAISNDTCCVSESGNAYQSVQVREGDACKSVTTFKDGDCAANITVTTTTGSVCFNSGGPTYTAASWERLPCINGTTVVENATTNGTTNVTSPASRRRALLSYLRSGNATPASARDCTRHVEVDDNVIYYRKDPTKGMWSLRIEGASQAQILERLSAVPDEEKVFWLFSHGASYNLEAEGHSFDIVEA